MQNFTRKLITEWRKLNLPFNEETFVVAVSGGADSVSLLLALHELRMLKKLNSRFIVAHFNHNLRGAESEQDEIFVKSLASYFNFELALGSGELSDEKGNLEQNARDARYRFLTETAENLDAYAVLTAHTLNDQAETFLFNLLRGSGIEGLSGMKPVRNLKFQFSNSKSEKLNEIKDQSAILLVRPLLNWARREDTENFCRLNEIEFRYDSMNEDLKFNRVRIRKVLIPLLKDFNPKIIETLAKTADLLRENAEQLSVNSQQESVISQEQAEDQKLKIKDQRSISLKDLRDVFPSMQRTILREWVRENRGNLRGLELKHFEAIEKLIFSRKSGKVVELPKGENVVKQNGKLKFVKVEKKGNSV